MTTAAERLQFSLLQAAPYLSEEIKFSEKAIQELQRGWPPEIALPLKGLNPAYSCYPYLFLAAFPTLDGRSVRPLALAGRLMASSLLLLDDVMDGQTPDLGGTTTNTLRALALRAEADQILYRLFPADAAFWRRFQAYYRDYVISCSQERRFCTDPTFWQSYTEETAAQIAVGKSGVAKAALAGLAELAQQDSCLNALISSVNHYNIATQLLDDLADWREDLRLHQPSVLLARLFSQNGLTQPLPGDVQTDEWARQIYYGGHALYILALAEQEIQYAAAVISDVAPTMLWQRVVAQLQQHCQTTKQDIQAIIEQNVRRVHAQPKISLAITPAQAAAQPLIWRTLRFILRQWQLGFGEARHAMGFAQAAGFTSQQEIQRGDVFQRAIIADILCDVNTLVQGQLTKVIAYEIRHLLNCRRQTGIGGWSYFPDLVELPPDADDLAQIMQLLLRTGNTAAVDRLCTAPLTVLLSDCLYEDGSFETWIIPRVQSPEQQRQAYFAQQAWGRGPDSDVMANLLYALKQYDAARFTAVIERGMAYLVSQQQATGCWLSTWYYGPYYGTYVCLRLLAGSPYTDAIACGVDFLCTTQHDDGGWGLNGHSDALNTALALLALAAVRSHSATAALPTAVERAHAYLQSQQEEDGSQAATPFIRMEMGRAGGRVFDVLSYGSRTMTSAFVLKAALAWLPEKVAC